MKTKERREFPIVENISHLNIHLNNETWIPDGNFLANKSGDNDYMEDQCFD